MSSEPRSACYTVGQVAATVGVSAQTLRVWEAKGLLQPGRTSGGRRRYSERDLERAGQVARLRRRHGWNPAAIADRAEVSPRPAERLRVGAVVRAARRAKGLSIAQLAQRIDISRSYVSALERGENELSVQLQTRIADALELALTDFAPSAEDASRLVVRPGDRLVTVLGGGVTWEELAVPGRAIEPALLHVPAGETSGGAVARPGENFVFVLEGRLRFELHEEGRDVVLEPEDAIVLPAGATWNWSNPFSSPARVLWVEQRPPTT